MKLKALILIFFATIVFLFADSRFHLLLFKIRPSFENTIKCSLSNSLDELSHTLKLKDDRSISTDINKVIFQLNLAYGVETKFAFLKNRSKITKDSQRAENIKTSIMRFNKFASLSDKEIGKKFSEIEVIANQTQELLKGIC